MCSDADILYMHNEISDNPSELEADHPKIMLGWPVYFRKEHCDGAYWTKPTKAAKKKPEYKPKMRCTMPEYLRDTMGDSKTVCTMCGRHCTRKQDNKGDI